MEDYSGVLSLKIYNYLLNKNNFGLGIINNTNDKVKHINQELISRLSKVLLILFVLFSVLLFFDAHNYIIIRDNYIEKLSYGTLTKTKYSFQDVDRIETKCVTDESKLSLGYTLILSDKTKINLFQSQQFNDESSRLERIEALDSVFRSVDIPVHIEIFKRIIGKDKVLIDKNCLSALEKRYSKKQANTIIQILKNKQNLKIGNIQTVNIDN